jgi:hypothetical protein
MNSQHTPFQKALEIRIAQGWQLGGNACPVLYTDTINGEQVCRDDLWLATTAGLKGSDPATVAQRFCNKCGYSGPDEQHDRPNGSGRCDYLSCVSAPSEGHPPAVVAQPAADLMRFYGVDSTDALISAQAQHIEKLQSKLQPAPSFAPQRVREG